MRTSTLLAAIRSSEAPERHLVGDLKSVIAERDILLAALLACVENTPQAIKAYGEDFGLPADLDNPRRIEVMIHALERVAEWRNVHPKATAVPVADIPPREWRP
jgi:hypothetical protein